MAVTDGMDTYEARVASFASATVGSSRRRASNAKGSKAHGWPHKAPTPGDLALAGFYFKPTAASSDNTVCFTCERKLDGWESEDDPFVEHLTHSPNCPWALATSPYIEGNSELYNEDPTSSKLADARRETFAGKWPHESKRGWVCKTERMVEAGWHYSPTPESDDSVSCAYCKLSLDGWEPKDNAFDEHYRRSPECRFFVFAGTSAPKATRGKKGRASKASRLSTQSNMTALSEAPSIPDFDDSIDQTMISQDTVMSTTTKAASKGGKPGKGRGKGAKAKKLESIPVEENPVLEPSEDIQPPKNKKGKKRTSEQISEDDDVRRERESTVRPEPPPKRRATKTRVSSASSVQYPTLSLEASAEEPQPKSTKGGRKRASSRAKKLSTASTASKASLRAGIPDDSAIEAELAAELDIPLSDEDVDMTAPLPKLGSKPKGRKGKAPASTAPIRQSPAEIIDEYETKDESMQLESSHLEQADDKPKKRGKAAKGKGKKKATAQPEESAGFDASDRAETALLPTSTNVFDESRITKGDEENTDTEMAELSKAKRGGKKGGTRSKAQRKKEESVTEPTNEIEERPVQILEEPTSIQKLLDSLPQPPVHNSGTEMYQSTENESEPAMTMPGAFDIDEATTEQPVSPLGADKVLHEEAREVEKQPTEPIRHVATPSPSPAPSDVENQPPSSRPSASRPPLLPMSPSKSQAIRIPVVTTPKQASPSKLNRPISSLTTSFPWTSVDIDLIFSQTPGAPNKENVFGGVDEALTSPEKRMTVEEWVSAMAKKTEQQFKDETEKVVGVFEKEGSRAMRALEGIECVD